MKKKIIMMITVTILSGLFITSCELIGQGTEPTPVPTPVFDPNVIAEANLLPAKEESLRFSIAGRVQDILVEEGDFVEAGRALARLENVDSFEAQILSAKLAELDAQQQIEDLGEKAELAAAQAQVDLAEAKQNLVEAERAWDEVDSDSFIDELDDARLDMIEAEEDLDDADQTLEDHQDLDEDNYLRQIYEDDVEGAQSDYDQARWAYEEFQNQQALARAQLEAAQAALENAEREVEATQDGRPDPDDMALAKANLEKAQGQLQAAERALGDVDLTAPFPGQVMRMELVEGALTTPEQLAVVLADISAWFLETNDLTEEEVVKINENDEVKISFDALPGETFTGEVESISDYFLERFGDITYVVRIRLLESDERLRWGMTAEVTFPD